MRNKKESSKLIHDMNSSLSSLMQGIDLALENVDVDTDLCKKVLNLSKEKINELAKCWEEIKEIIREK